MAKDYSELADQVVELIGGAGNVTYYAHCITRLRFNLKNKDLAQVEALADLPGRHDFAAFQAAGGTAKTTVRTILGAELASDGPDITLTVSGDAFLYNMVRIISGTLVEIGLGKRNPDAFRKAFTSGSRLDLGMTAPPAGLELTEVRYPEKAFTNPAAIRWHKPDEEEGD